MPFINDFLSLIYPRHCEACSNVLFGHEAFLCNYCIHNLPRYDSDSKNNLQNVLAGRVPLNEAQSVFQFEKGGRVQKILHAIKYQGQKELAEFVGNLYAKEWYSKNIFSDIDIIIPVPLHQKKLNKRGFNQSEWFAKGLSIVFGKSIDTGKLFRIKETETQTRKKKYERWENVEGIFELKDEIGFEKKHVLLVDDVITTGSTIDAAFQPFKGISGIRISLATIAFARQM